MGNFLCDIFDLRSIKLGLDGKTKDSVFVELIDAITGVYPEYNTAEILAEIQAREEKMTTGISSGIAIPHAYCNGIKNIIGAIGVSQQGIDYGALDNKPVHVVFLLTISKEKKENHLHTLNVIFQLAQSEAINRIKSAKNAEEIHDILSKARS